MAIISVIENTREATASKEVDELDFTGEANRVFDIQFSADTNLVSMPILAVDCNLIPQLWDIHPDDPWMYVIRIGPSKFKSAYIQEVPVYYSRLEEPLLIPPRLSYSFAQINEPIDRDNQGKAITNSAGETFDPPLLEDIDVLVVRIEKNAADYNAMVSADYKGSVNSDTFWGFPPGCVKLKVFEGRQARSANLTYWQIVYELHFRYDTTQAGNQVGWKRRVLDQGFRTKTGTNPDGTPKYEILKDKDGSPLTQPQLLDGSGAKLGAAAAAVFLTFKTYKERAFTPLGIM